MYHTLQEEADAISVKDLAAMDQEIESNREAIATLKSNEKILRSNLASVNTSMSTEDLSFKVEALEVEKKTLLSRLEPLRKGDVKPVQPQEKAIVDRLWTTWKRTMEGRKKMTLEMWASGTEALPEGKTKGELWVKSQIWKL